MIDDVLWITGAVVVAFGLGMIYLPLGVIASGLLLIALGVILGYRKAMNNESHQ